MSRGRVGIVGLVVLGGMATALGQEAEQAKLLARRAAIADAYRKLAETVYGLQINSQTYVRDFVTENDEIATAVDTMVRGIRIGETRFLEDGSAEVDAEVTVAKVIETLREAHTRHYQGDRVKAEDFVQLSQRTEKRIIRVVGVGAPRLDLPPHLPPGVEELLPPPPPNPPPPALPGVWRTVPAQARFMAQRAAEVDAKRQLAERIKGLRLTSRTQVRDFVTESDVITTELMATLVGAQIKSVYYRPDELIVEVTVAIPTEQVITTVKQLHSRHYKGDDVQVRDIDDITRTVVKRDFEATGMGVPPARMMRSVAAVDAPPRPQWVDGLIRAEGTGTDPGFATAQGRLKAARAAELDAKRRLAEMIAGLQLDGQTRVTDFVTEHDSIATQVEAIMVDSFVVETRFDNDAAYVTVAVPGTRVWSVLGPELRRQSR